MAYHTRLDAVATFGTTLLVQFKVAPKAVEKALFTRVSPACGWDVSTSNFQQPFDPWQHRDKSFLPSCLRTQSSVTGHNHGRPRFVERPPRRAVVSKEHN